MNNSKLLLRLTPFKPPTHVTTTDISVEQNFNCVGVADNLPPPVGIRIHPYVKESKSSAIFVSDCDSIIFSFNVNVSETDPNGIALRNLDFLDLVEVVRISFLFYFIFLGS